MKKSLFVFPLWCLFAALPLMAQETVRSSDENPSYARLSPGNASSTPEMWFYEQYRADHLDPKLAVRRNAEFRANQRRRRIESMKWFGFSNARPTVGVDPYHGDWSPRWVSGNGRHPYRWAGVGRPTVIVHSR